jgi:uncharacterized protein YdgA (DUF945 family)
MKKLIVIIVLIIVIAAGLPFLNGILMESYAKKAVENLNLMQANNPFGYSVEIVNYERGYSSTDLELKVNTGVLKDIYGIDSVIITEHAKHGYMGVSSTGSLMGNEWYSSLIKDRLQGRDPLHIETNYSIFGGITSDLTLDDFSAGMEDKNIHIKQAEIEIESDRSLQNYVISGTWQGMDIDQKFSVNEVSMKMDMEMITGSLWDGDMSVDIKNVDVIDKGTEAKISGLKMQTASDVDIDSNSLGFGVDYNIKSIRSKDKNIEDASVHLSVKGLKIDALEEFRKTYFEMLSQVMPRIASRDHGRLNEDQMKKEMALISLKLAASYEKLLKEGLEIKVSNAHVKLPQGDVDGSVTMRLLKDMTFAQFLPGINKPEDLLDVLYLKTDIRLPVELVGKNPSLLQPPVPEMKTGIFIKDGDYLVNKMETEDGKLILNGDPVPLDEIASRLGAGPQGGNAQIK